MEFFLVQVGYKLLIWGGQLWEVAREKAIKVLRITPTLPWRGEEREMEKEIGGWSEFDEGCEEKKDNNKQQGEKKRNTTKTWHQPIKSFTAETVDFNWSVCEPVTS